MENGEKVMEAAPEGVQPFASGTGRLDQKAMATPNLLIIIKN